MRENNLRFLRFKKATAECTSSLLKRNINCRAWLFGIAGAIQAQIIGHKTDSITVRAITEYCMWQDSTNSDKSNLRRGLIIKLHDSRWSLSNLANKTSTSSARSWVKLSLRIKHFHHFIIRITAHTYKLIFTYLAPVITLFIEVQQTSFITWTCWAAFSKGQPKRKNNSTRNWFKITFVGCSVNTVF